MMDIPIRWLGGKGRAAPSISELFGARCKGFYYEPFFGGGSVYFYRVAFREVDPKKAFLSDVNAGLINFWKMVQSNPLEVYHYVQGLPKEISPSSYKEMRDRWNSEARKQVGTREAALFYWLNRSGFNGLWRENVKGELNTSIGSRTVFDVESSKVFTDISEMLQGAILEVNPFQRALLVEMVEKNDQIYADPPYLELKAGSDFNEYSAGGFSVKDHHELADLLRQASNTGARVIASNHDTQEVRSIYKDFHILSYHASRRIQPSAEKTAKEVFLVRGG